MTVSFRQRLVMAWRTLRGRVHVPKVVYTYPDPIWVQVLYFQDNLLALDNLGALWFIRVDGMGRFVVECPPVLTTPKRY